MRSFEYTLQRCFIRFLIMQSRIDHLIGRSTGRNPDNLSRTKQDIMHWEGELLLLDINHAA